MMEAVAVGAMSAGCPSAGDDSMFGLVMLGCTTEDGAESTSSAPAIGVAGALLELGRGAPSPLPFRHQVSSSRIFSKQSYKK